jgi:N-methylhydantoinase A
MRLDVEGAHAAIRERVAKPLGVSVVEAADGIFRLVNANMANAVRRISAGRGVDPRPLTLVVFGGNGAVHAGMQAAELGIRRIFVPKLAPAVLGARPPPDRPRRRRDALVHQPVGRVDLARVDALFAEMEAAARAALAADGRAPRSASSAWRRSATRADLRHAGRAAGARRARHGATLAETVERFHRLHEELPHVRCRDEEPILRGLRLKAVAVEEKPPLPRVAGRARGAPRLGARKAFFAAASSRRRSTTARS